MGKIFQNPEQPPDLSSTYIDCGFKPFLHHRWTVEFLKIVFQIKRTLRNCKTNIIPMQDNYVTEQMFVYHVFEWRIQCSIWLALNVVYCPFLPFAFPIKPYAHQNNPLMFFNSHLKFIGGEEFIIIYYHCSIAVLKAVKTHNDARGH